MKTTAIALMLVLLLGLFAACTENKTNESQKPDLPAPTGQSDVSDIPTQESGQTQSPELPSGTDMTQDSSLTEPAATTEQAPEEDEGGLAIEDDLVVEVTGNIGIGGN